MIIVIIKTVIFTLCTLVVLLMIFSRKYNFCIWKKYKIPKVYFSNSKYVYDKFMDVVSNDKIRSRIEIDIAHNTIRIETKGSSKVLTYIFSKYKVIDEGTNIEFMFEDGYEIERASLELKTWRNELIFRQLEITAKGSDSIIQYFE